ncbi:uncharacterized protein EI90DRAFT_3136729 [Cantharellus anzutake]|uniref:uncharacterized protein n=1 Tax=Cantharellus anzutake TaxID=1750568 RepID=UPI0019038978|nr:uncharacterized protein EI90DRAFT_3136729 [Cantharellus anzutake]KAF8313340.1 hypothetical protein EI90DRAFT_3136729 [Cantharellus anzutake]
MAEDSEPSSPVPPPTLSPPTSRHLSFNFLRSQNWNGALEHYSTSLPRGSQTFLVQGRRFVVPKALLAQNSDVFLEISPDENSKDVTTLDDHSEAFEDFVDVLFNPFTSCLLRPSPPLRKILHILQISNKYCCEVIEGLARPLAVRMTQKENIRSHIDSSLSALSIFRIGIKASEPSIYRNAWELILESFRKQKMTSYDLIDEGRRSGLRELLASAFYEVMISGRKKWDEEPGLTLHERQALTRGMLSCTEDWDAFVSRLASGDLEVPYQRSPAISSLGMMPENVPPKTPVRHCDYHDRHHYNAELATISQINASYKVPTYDVMGRLSRIKQEVLDHLMNKCWDDVVSCADETKAFIESRLPFYFVEEQHRRNPRETHFADELSDIDSLDLDVKY